MNQDQLQLDKQRVSLLLNINTLLIQKAILIQQQLKEQQQQQQQSPSIAKLNELLQHLLKRLHSNLSCIGELSTAAQGSQQKRLIFPSILNPPPEFFEFNEYYIALQKLFPEGVAVLTQRIKQMNGQMPAGQRPLQQHQGQQFW